MRFATIAVWVSLFLISLISPASARPLTWEAWGENAVAASASEGTHAWITHGLYERGSEVGMNKWQAAGTAMGIMLVWEVVEVKGMDALGVSVQDIAANSLGILAGIAGLGVNYQYVTFTDPPEHDKVWMNIPCAPRNDMSYSFELQSGQVTGNAWVHRDPPSRLRKLACFGTRSHRHLKEILASEAFRQPRRRSNKRKGDTKRRRR